MKSREYERLLRENEALRKEKEDREWRKFADLLHKHTRMREDFLVLRTIFANRPFHDEAIVEQMDETLKVTKPNLKGPFGEALGHLETEAHAKDRTHH